MDGLPPKKWSSYFKFTSLYLPEVFFRKQSHWPRELLPHEISEDYLKRRATEAVNRARPFCRRFFNTLRPDAVWLRLRKPNLRARRIFEGLYVGFIEKLTNVKKKHSKVKHSTKIKLLIWSCEIKFSWQDGCFGCPVRLARSGHRVFIPATGVRIPYGTPLFLRTSKRSLDNTPCL